MRAKSMIGKLATATLLGASVGVAALALPAAAVPPPQGCTVGVNSGGGITSYCERSTNLTHQAYVDCKRLSGQAYRKHSDWAKPGHATFSIKCISGDIRVGFDMNYHPA